MTKLEVHGQKKQGTQQKEPNSRRENEKHEHLLPRIHHVPLYQSNQEKILAAICFEYINVIQKRHVIEICSVVTNILIFG